MCSTPSMVQTLLAWEMQDPWWLKAEKSKSLCFLPCGENRMMKWFKSLRWGLRHFYLCNSLSSVSDSGKDSNGKFPTWVNISASPCLSLLMHIYIPLASRWAITRRNKKVTIRESDLQTAFNAWSCILPQTAEGKDSEKVSMSDLFLGISSQIPQFRDFLGCILRLLTTPLVFHGYLFHQRGE